MPCRSNTNSYFPGKIRGQGAFQEVFFECSLCPAARGDTAGLPASGGRWACPGNATLLKHTPNAPLRPDNKVSQNIRYATSHSLDKKHSGACILQEKPRTF